MTSANENIIKVTRDTLTPALAEAIADLGRQSAKSQGLPVPITTIDKLHTSADHVYLCQLRSGSQLRFGGILRVGTRKLYLYDSVAVLHEVEPYCCLDFYVHESLRRQGVGQRLFHEMLNQEKLASPGQMAFDKPSSNAFSFLAGCFNLHQTIEQSNNFVIFSEFFPGTKPMLLGKHVRRAHQTVAKSHYDSSLVASLLSSGSGIMQPSIHDSRQHDLATVDESSMIKLSTSECCPPSPVQEGKQESSKSSEDMELLKTTEENLRFINRKIEEREILIRKMERQLQEYDDDSPGYQCNRIGKDGFSKTEVIRKVHGAKKMSGSR
uniref:Alpha-tubulin N-acetyltransferase n=1 Tax=Spongospora subterranea TaxID=70186 RepID=A0A0H5QHS0_9EUKA|eukprot:CRZ01523.1 hypothetical protein [Spongospora subterranea]